MSIDVTTSLSGSTTSGTPKPLDVHSLQETFATILRSYGTEKGGSPTHTLLEIAPLSHANDRDRNQQRREQQQHVDRNDFTQIDRNQRDKSEIRSREMSSDYQDRTDQQKNLHDDYWEKTEHRELPLAAAPTDTFPSETSPALLLDAVRPIESLPHGNHVLPQNNGQGIVNTQSRSPLVSPDSAPNYAADTGQAHVVLPMNVNAPPSMLTPGTPQTAPLQTFTVFTPSGRWGQSQDHVDEEEGEEEKPNEKKVGKKKQSPFAVFEAIRAETARPLQPNHARHSSELISKTEQQIIEKFRGDAKEVETDLSRSVNPVEECLHSLEQSIFMQKRGEQQPDQTRYLHRIAAACEAAALYAPIRMKINLDHLGTLTLRFFYKADKLALRFESPSNESAQFLRNHLEGLKIILSKRNVRIVDIEIFNENQERVQ